MMRLFLLLAVGAALNLAGAPVRLGDGAPELLGVKWLGAAPGARSGKAPAVYFFWRPKAADIKAIPKVVRQAKRWRREGTRFVAVGIGSEKELRTAPLFSHFDFPVAADEKGENARRFLRPGQLTPVAVVIDGAGRVVWRGAVERISAVLERIGAGKWNLDVARRQDDFSCAFSALMLKSDYAGALKLLDRELAAKPVNPPELVALQLGIYLKRLNSPDGALAAVRAAQKRFPDRIEFYEMELKLVEQLGKEEWLADFYPRLIRKFGDQPRRLLDFVRYELARPLEKMRPADAYAVARAACRAKKFKDKREQGRVNLYYAQTLYCCGRVELAAKAARRAVELLDGFPEQKQARGIAGFYQKLVELAPTIKE